MKNLIFDLSCKHLNVNIKKWFSSYESGTSSQSLFLISCSLLQYLFRFFLFFSFEKLVNVLLSLPLSFMYNLPMCYRIFFPLWIISLIHCYLFPLMKNLYVLLSLSLSFTKNLFMDCHLLPLWIICMCCYRFFFPLWKISMCYYLFLLPWRRIFLCTAISFLYE